MHADMNIERSSPRFHSKGKAGQFDSQASNVYSVMASYSSLFRSISDSLEPFGRHTAWRSRAEFVHVWRPLDGCRAQIMENGMTGMTGMTHQGMMFRRWPRPKFVSWAQSALLHCRVIDAVLHTWQCASHTEHAAFAVCLQCNQALPSLRSWLDSQ